MEPSVPTPQDAISALEESLSQQALSPLVELLYDDSCDCHGELPDFLKKIATLSAFDVNLQSLSAWSSDPIQQIRVKKSDLRIVVCGCETHKAETLPLFEPVDVFVPLSVTMKQQTQEELLHDALSQAKELVIENKALERPAASSPFLERRSFQAWDPAPAPAPQEAVTSSAPAPQMQTPQVQTPQVQAPQAAPAPVLAPPASQGSHFFTKPQSAASQGKYFTAPKKKKSKLRWVLFAALLVGAYMLGRSAPQPANPPTQERPATTQQEPAKRPALQKTKKEVGQTPKKAPLVAPQPSDAGTKRQPPPRPNKSTDKGSDDDSSDDDSSNDDSSGDDSSDDKSKDSSKTTNASIGKQWIGDSCRSSAQCALKDGICQKIRGSHFCTAACKRLCPDLETPRRSSYCMALDPSEGGIKGAGSCMLACDFKRFPKKGCRQGMRCRSRVWRKYPKKKRRVCVPAK